MRGSRPAPSAALREMRQASYAAAMRERLRRWFAKPRPDAPPAATLRWVARIALAVAALGALSGLRMLVDDDGEPWVMFAGSGLLVSSALLLQFAARSSTRDRSRPRAMITGGPRSG